MGLAGGLAASCHCSPPSVSSLHPDSRHLSLSACLSQVQTNHTWAERREIIMTENREGTGLPPRSPGSPLLSAARCQSRSSARRQRCAEPPGGGCSDSLWWAPSKWFWKRKGKRLGAGVAAERGVWPLLTQEKARTSLGDTMEVLGLFWMFCCGHVSVILKAKTGFCLSGHTAV